jgi:hypothetical protein
VKSGFPQVQTLNKLSLSPQDSFLNLQADKIEPKSGAKFTFPHQIISFDSILIGNYQFFIAAAAITIHIMKAHIQNPSILPVFEKNYEETITELL